MRLYRKAALGSTIALALTLAAGLRAHAQVAIGQGTSQPLLPSSTTPELAGSTLAPTSGTTGTVQVSTPTLTTTVITVTSPGAAIPATSVATTTTTTTTTPASSASPGATGGASAIVSGANGSGGNTGPGFSSVGVTALGQPTTSIPNYAQTSIIAFAVPGQVAGFSGALGGAAVGATNSAGVGSAGGASGGAATGTTSSTGIGSTGVGGTGPVGPSGVAAITPYLDEVSALGGVTP